MAYTEVGVVNLALQRIGADRITSLTQDIAQAEAANAAWEYIRDEVLEAGDWNFAKRRTTLSKIPQRVDLNAGDGKHLRVMAYEWEEDTDDISIELIMNDSDALSVALESGSTTNIQIKLANATASKNTAALIQAAIRALTTVNGISVAAWTVTANDIWTAAAPVGDVDLDAVDMQAAAPGTYAYAYLMPTDFLKIATSKHIDAAVDPTGAITTIFTDTGMLLTTSAGLYSYALETLEDDTPILVTDYEATEDYPLELVYISQVTDVTKWTAHFISTVAFRLAAELSFIVTEGAAKFQLMMEAYEIWLRKATGLNQSSDHVPDETGSEDWELAGRT
jgi:hypothetical protein